jgi:hypothetical protein
MASTANRAQKIRSDIDESKPERERETVNIRETSVRKGAQRETIGATEMTTTSGITILLRFIQHKNNESEGRHHIFYSFLRNVGLF